MNEGIKSVKKYGDFRKVFSVFMGEPFYEAWDEDMLYNEYQEIRNNGDMFGYYVNDEIVSLLNIMYGAKKEHPVVFENPEKIIYLSDIATIPHKRHYGYGQKMADFSIEYAKTLNYYNGIYLRTNYKNSMSQNLFYHNDFRDMYDENGNIITQDIEFDRTRDDISRIDTRKFLSRRLTK